MRLAMHHVAIFACFMQEWFEYIWPFGGGGDGRNEELDG